MDMTATSSSSTAIADTTVAVSDLSFEDAWRVQIKKMNDILDAEKERLKRERDALEKEKEMWQRSVVHLEATQIEDPVVLNVGGTMFATSLETLSKLPNSYFGSMLSGRWDLKRSKTDGSIFIDRNPRVFGHIMDFMRGYPSEDFSSTWTPLSPAKKKQLRRECDFYNLPELLACADAATPFSVKSPPATTTTANTTLPSRVKALIQGLVAFNLEERLLYQWSVDGAGEAIFHQKCDYQGPTITIGTLNDGRLIGGYASLSWANASGCKADRNAFLFLIPAEMNAPVQQLKQIECPNTEAVCHSPSYGPVFGGGYDLCFNLGKQLCLGRCLSFTYQPHGIASNTPLADVSVWSISIK